MTLALPAPISSPEHERLRREVARLTDENENLRRALATRDLIWEAKLIIAATTQCTAAEAHELLTAQSQHQNRKLVAVAAEIVAKATESDRA